MPINPYGIAEWYISYLIGVVNKLLGLAVHDVGSGPKAGDHSIIGCNVGATYLQLSQVGITSFVESELADIAWKIDAGAVVLAAKRFLMPTTALVIPSAELNTSSSVGELGLGYSFLQPTATVRVANIVIYISFFMVLYLEIGNER
jgi:hypothetical protein